MYIDSLYIILVMPAVLLAFYAQYKVSATFKKYSAVKNLRGVTGADAARAVLEQNGITNVSIQKIQGNLTDNFDPRTNIIRLSAGVYDSDSVAAVGVAAHEAGHAAQHAGGYTPIKIRNAVLPAAKIGSNMAMPLIILGFVLSLANLVYAGIILFGAAVLFQIVTLPVEINASRRAMASISAGGLLSASEAAGARRVLSAAALTYIAAAAVALAQLLRFVLLARGGRRRD